MNSYKIINISSKNFSYRRACVCGSIFVGENVFNLIKNNKIEKGDPLVLSEIAGINAVKKTSDLILLCHHVNIEHVFFNLFLDDINFSITSYSVVSAYAKTGVEMEAMFGVLVSLLTIYDLVKKYNPLCYIKDVRLLFKEGGETGNVIGSLNLLPIEIKKFFLNRFNLLNISVFLVTVSDRASFGRYKDLSGHALIRFFSDKQSTILGNIIIPDDEIILFNVLKNIVEKFSPKVIVTSGGTGISSRDITSDVISNLCNKLVSGLGEYIRLKGAYYSENSWLSRSISGIYKKTLIVSLPGKPEAVSQSLYALDSLILHAVNTIDEHD